MTILRWALLFFLISIVAGILGFTDISAASADIARFLFYVFVVIVADTRAHDLQGIVPEASTASSCPGLSRASTFFVG
jgi:uncharacterized membrane protein YtjA (UPF0391 family)